MPLAPFPLLDLKLDRKDNVPLHRQLYRQIREQILSGRLPPEFRLPSSRKLAVQYGISRTTVVTAQEQLLAEGYLVARRGAGTHVACLGHDAPAPPVPLPEPSTRKPLRLSRRGVSLARSTRNQGPGGHVFTPGLPDLDAFPHALWARLLGRTSRRPPPATCGYEDPAGYMPLRRALADYLTSSRGAVCKAEQIVITTGAQAALDLAARLLSSRGDTVWLEEPGYQGARAAFTGSGARIIPVPVDKDGLSLAAGRNAARPHLIYVTPSHQYPLGMNMPLARRLELLEFADESACWIIEDDYDSEFPMAGRPLPCLQGLRPGSRTVYVGTLSKSMLPGLRMGYLVVPEPLAEDFARALRNSGQMAAVTLQAALTDFITGGHYAGHIRKMRRRYADKRALLLAALDRYFGDEYRPGPGGGLQVAVHFDPQRDDRRLESRAHAAGLAGAALSRFCLTAGSANGLLLGIGAMRPEEIEPATARLHAALAGEFIPSAHG